MTKLRIFGIVLAYLATVALVCFVHMLIFGKESTINSILACVISGSTIGLYVIVGLMLCTAICAIAISGKEKESVDTKKLVNSNEQKVTLKDVIVSDEVKKRLKRVCNNELKETREKLERLGFKTPNGYLFYGPPGTGKTLLAKAIAGEANISFTNISASELVGAYSGQGVYHVRNFFAQARKKAPCIVFIDEIDSIGADRSTNSNGSASVSQSQTLNQLLIEMSNCKGVTVIAATNRKDALDSALIRSGRFDEKIYIPLPDMSLREKILDLYMKGVSRAPDLDLKEVAGKTEGYSGADLEHLVNEVKRYIVERTEGTNKELTVTMDDFNSVLEKQKSEFQKPNDEEKNVEDMSSKIGKLRSFIDSIVQERIDKLHAV